ncbi:MAG TPA: 2-C-methyl-D-erythritol 4-phosphate cytidylyltransferase, partial [Phycisphaerales bacterium]|nr:2-C-methyl-D-erythritol 4-phosphate cytidylyltransferase [Phycisphaerales bacterium]
MNRDVVALVPAAGFGTRLGMGHKAFLSLNGRTLIARVIEMLSVTTDRIVAALPQDILTTVCRTFPKTVQCIPGGQSRAHTLSLLAEHIDRSVVLVHDAACPFTGLPLILEVLTAARTHRAAAAYAPPVHPAAQLDGGYLTAC